MAQRRRAQEASEGCGGVFGQRGPELGGEARPLHEVRAVGFEQDPERVQHVAVQLRGQFVVDGHGRAVSEYFRNPLHVDREKFCAVLDVRCERQRLGFVGFVSVPGAVSVATQLAELQQRAKVAFRGSALLLFLRLWRHDA